MFFSKKETKSEIDLRKREIDLWDERINLKKREYAIAEQEIELINKLNDVSKTAKLLEENNYLKKENEILLRDNAMWQTCITLSSENGCKITKSY